MQIMGSNGGERSFDQTLRNLANHFRSNHLPARSSVGKRAAVLVCLFIGDGGEMRVILTKRSSNLSSHSGEVALPGGKVEEGDADDAATALREAEEEIGLSRSLLTLLSVAEPFVTKIGMTVVPVIGLLRDRKAFVPSLNTEEVEDIFDAPLEMFLKDENRRKEEREWNGNRYFLHFFDYEADGNRKFVIWALTAGILIEVASIAFQRPPAFVENRPKFWKGFLNRMKDTAITF